MLDWSQTHCGVFQIKKDPVIQRYVRFRGLPMDEAHVTQIREERLNEMLQKDIDSKESKWISYTEERVEIGVELGDLVIEALLNDFIVDLEDIH